VPSGHTIVDAGEGATGLSVKSRTEDNVEVVCFARGKQQFDEFRVVSGGSKGGYVERCDVARLPGECVVVLDREPKRQAALGVRNQMAVSVPWNLIRDGEGQLARQRACQTRLGPAIVEGCGSDRAQNFDLIGFVKAA